MTPLIPHSRPTVGPREAAAAARVARSGRLVEGPEVEAFEKEVARVVGARHAAAVASGTAALELALRALGVRPGDEVLIPTFVCSALWHSVKRAGAEPVLVDCEDGGVNACMKDAARRRTRKTKALILVHSFGLPADLAGARALGLPIIEDCAQSLGGAWRGRPLGSWGEASVLSFYATKLVTTGEGGMTLSSDRRLVERVRALREYDERRPTEVRANCKMTDIQAAIGRVQLRRLPSFLAERRRLARAYAAELRGLAAPPDGDVPGRVFFRYVLRLGRPGVDAVSAALARDGVSARRPVWRPLHLDVPAGGSFPNADRAWRSRLSIPLYPGLSPWEQRRVVFSLRRRLGTVDGDY